MNLAWFIFITIIVMLVQGFIFGKWGLHRIHYTRSFSKRTVFVGEKIEMIDEISNKKLLPVPWLRLESKISANLQFDQKFEYHTEIHGSGDYHRTLFSLLPYQKVRRRQTLTCQKRGHYRFKTVSLTTGDVFGISEIFKTVPAQAEVIVYPPLVPLADIPFPTHSWLGDIVVKRWVMEDPFIMAGIREYQSGDPFHAINWKATAKTNRLQVNKRDFTADHNLMIYLNFNQTEDMWRPIVSEERMELAISYAASIAYYAITNGLPTGFGCNGYFADAEKEPIVVEPANGMTHLHVLLEAMAKLEIGTSTYIDFFLQKELEKGRTNMDILIITDVVTDGMRECIEQFRADGNAVEVIELVPPSFLSAAN